MVGEVSMDEKVWLSVIQIVLPWPLANQVKCESRSEVDDQFVK